MSDHTDPFEELASPIEPRPPRPSFTRDLRSRLLGELGLDADQAPATPSPERSTTMTTAPAAATGRIATAVTPYLAASDGAAALDWYAEAFGAVEAFRVVGDDGKLGHAEFQIGTARFMLSDEYPEMGVTSPSTLGGTATSLHLEVTDVDALFARAVATGATAQAEPADQPHGARHGSLLDPYGHRWMLSQPIEAFDLATYAERSRGTGFSVEPGTGATRPEHRGSGIWAALNYADAPAGIRFLTETLGFERDLVVADEHDPDVIVHSQLSWPEGGTVMAASAGRHHNEFSDRPTGTESLYVISADPMAVWARCQQAGVEVVAPPESPDYDPGGTVFSIRDPEGNIFSFGTYAGEG